MKLTGMLVGWLFFLAGCQTMPSKQFAPIPPLTSLVIHTTIFEDAKFEKELTSEEGQQIRQEFLDALATTLQKDGISIVSEGENILTAKLHYTLRFAIPPRHLDVNATLHSNQVPIVTFESTIMIGLIYTPQELARAAGEILAKNFLAKIPPKSFSFYEVQPHMRFNLVKTS